MLTSAGGSSCSPSTFFVDFEGADETCDAPRLSEADARLVTIPVVSLSNDRGGGCNAVAGVEDCTCEVGASGALLLG